jgi:hypothetical protein
MAVVGSRSMICRPWAEVRRRKAIVVAEYYAPLAPNICTYSLSALSNAATSLYNALLVDTGNLSGSAVTDKTKHNSKLFLNTPEELCVAWRFLQ